MSRRFRLTCGGIFYAFLDELLSSRSPESFFSLNRSQGLHKRWIAQHKVERPHTQWNQTLLLLS